MMERKRRNVTVPGDVDAILAQVGNASAYVSTLVREHYQHWMAAISTLERAGWSGREIRAFAAKAACLAPVPRPSAAEVAEHADRYGPPEKQGAREILPKRWRELVHSMELNKAGELDAVLTVAEELRRGNLLVSLVLAKLPQSEPERERHTKERKRG